jgi:hypothetical protein
MTKSMLELDHDERPVLLLSPAFGKVPFLIYFSGLPFSLKFCISPYSTKLSLGLYLCTLYSSVRGSSSSPIGLKVSLSGYPNP